MPGRGREREREEEMKKFYEIAVGKKGTRGRTSAIEISFRYAHFRNKML